ncbi:MAG: hypothetical protein ABII88_10670 [Candidatus Omnitrophota bacterium]
MFKRKIICYTVIVLLFIAAINTVKVYGEDLKKPLLDLPHVVGDDLLPDAFMPEESREKTGIEDSSGFFSFAYGRFHSSTYDIKQSARGDNFYYTARINIDDSGGERDNSKFTTYRPSFELGIPFDRENEAVFKVNYFNKIMNLPGKMDALTPGAKRKNTDFEISAQFIRGLDNGQVKIEPYYGRSILDEDINRRDFRNKLLGTRINFEADENEVKIDAFDNKLVDRYEHLITDAKIRLKPIPLDEQWQFRLGANIFAQEGFGQRPSPYVELMFSSQEDSSHKLKATREFAPLVFREIYLNDNFVEATPLELRPRRKSIISYEFDKYVSREWRTNLVIYVQQDKDLWFWNDPDNNGLYSPEIIEKVNFGGIKISTEYTWSEAFSHFISLNLRSITSKDPDYEFVPFEPKQRIAVGLTYKIDERFKMDITGDYFGRRFFQGNSKESFSAYFLLASKLTYQLKDYLTLFVLVDNLLNDHYEIVKGYPSQSRSALAGASVKF